MRDRRSSTATGSPRKTRQYIGGERKKVARTGKRGGLVRPVKPAGRSRQEGGRDV